MTIRKQEVALLRSGLTVLLVWFGLFLSVRPSQAAPISHSPRDEAEPVGEQTVYLPNVFRGYWHILAPFRPVPADGAVDVSLNTFLRWSDNPASLPDEDRPFQYEVYLDAGESVAAEPYAVTTRNALDTSTLMSDTLYTWQVVAIDPYGRRFVGPEWTFTTLAVPAEEDIDTDAMVIVPAGEFVMGCDRNNPHDESLKPCNMLGTGPGAEPLHTVYLDAYAIDQYEVTNQEYLECQLAGVCTPPRSYTSFLRSSYFNTEEYALYPVIYVSWQNAQDFCAWEGKRLPTEAEWEKAARGSIDHRAWPWGHETFTCDRMQYPRDNVCSHVYDTVRVGEFPNGMSPYGAYDMAGNVAEWVQDKYDQTYYHWSPYANPQGSDVSRISKGLNIDSDEFGHPTYVLRGGDFLGRFYYHFTYYRYWGHWGLFVGDDEPLFRNKRTGFRCAQSLAETD